MKIYNRSNKLVKNNEINNTIFLQRTCLIILPYLYFTIFIPPQTKFVGGILESSYGRLVGRSVGHGVGRSEKVCGANFFHISQAIGMKPEIYYHHGE